MIDRRHRYTSTRDSHTRHKPPCTWAGLAVYAGAALIVPLTLFALAHPTVVAAAVLGASAGLLARPLHRALTRPDHQSSDTPRRSDAVRPATARE